MPGEAEGEEVPVGLHERVAVVWLKDTQLGEQLCEGVPETECVPEEDAR